MTGTLQFKLPEEQPEFNMAVAAGRMASALWDTAQELRRRRKYENDKMAERLEKWFYEMLEMYGINLDTLCG